MAGVSRREALDLALRAHEDHLLASASALRQAAFGRRVELCAIINARSGDCGMDCRFCSQSRYYDTAAPVFPLLGTAALHERLRQLADVPLRHVGIVSSGGALAGEELDSLRRTLESLPPAWRGRVCGSLGRLSARALEGLRHAGLKRFHHNLETAEEFYPNVCATQRWRDRLAVVRRARRTGLEICSGGLFGLGETWEHRVDFALKLRDEGVSEVPVNFLHAHAGTPLAHMPPLSSAEGLRIIAVLRHILPAATLRVCGGRPTVLGERQKDMFAAGANALMTGNYLTTTGRTAEDDCAMIAAQGLEVTA